MSKKQGFLIRWFWRLNVLVILALLLAYLGTRVSPETFWPLAFFSLAYPFILLLNTALLLVWIVLGRKRKAFIVLASILIGWTTLFKFVQLIPSAADEGGSKVLSFNVRLFDLYNWSQNSRTRDQIIDLFNRENPDILCLQEFYDSGDSNYLITKDDLRKQTGLASIHDEYSQHTRNDHHFGIATLSKYPIVAKGQVALAEEKNNMCIWTDVIMQSDTVRVYNAHLASIHFGSADYAFIQEPGSEKNVKSMEGVNNVSRVVGLLKVAFQKRAKQVAEIKAHMKTCPHPIIYAGDLNDSPTSYAYGELTDGLKDAFISSGSGIGSTYIGVFPSFRIDHIMHSNELISSGFKTMNDELSDHHPISCVIKLAE